MSHHDVVVVGAGLAGLTAAVRLAEAGARVLVLAKGVGATHLGAGHDRRPRLRARARRAARARRSARSWRAPEHPYARVGADGVARGASTGSRRASRAARSRPTPTRARSSENLLLPTAVGVPRAVGASCRRRWPAATCATRRPGLRRRLPRRSRTSTRRCSPTSSRRAGVRGARRSSSTCVPEGRADVNALGFARAFDDPAFRGAGGRRSSAAAARAATSASRSRPCSASRDPHGVWSDARARARAAGVRGADAAAVGARACACSRSCARRCAAPAARVRAQQRRGRRRARRRRA